MAFKHFADMAYSPEEKQEKVMERLSPPMEDVNDYPYGLCISLSERELELLGCEDDDPEVGDYLHLFGLAKVTSVSANDRGDGKSKRVELVFVALRAEDEADEDEDEAAD